MGREYAGGRVLPACLFGGRDNDIWYLLGGLYEEEEQSAEAYRRAAQGELTLSCALYYNDQPPQMMYYAARAMEALGEREEASRRFRAFIGYAEEHWEDEVGIDYFAVSLPDFLVFEGDLKRNNRVHCCLMAALGHLGLGNREEAVRWARRGLSENCCQGELLDIVNTAGL